MKHPIWKRWLSHFRHVHLESVESDLNRLLHVYLVKGRHQLLAENVVHSFDDLYVNFDTAFAQLDIKAKAPKKILLLGLGLGSIPFMLEYKYGVKAEYTAVEIDDAVIYLANKYSLSDLKSPISYICADAEGFVQSCQDQYDLICIDIFEDDFVPPQFETTEFLQDIKALLLPNGQVLYNRLSHFEEDIRRTQRLMDDHFKPVFPTAYYVDAKGNWIFVGEHVL